MSGVNDGNNLDAGRLAQGCDFGQFTCAVEGDPIPAAPAGLVQGFGALAACVAEEAERVRKILGGQATLFGKPLGREVVGVAVCRRLADLDQTLFDATFQIRIRQPERDSQVLSDGTLGDALILVNGVQDAKSDLGFVGFADRYALSVAHE